MNKYIAAPENIDILLRRLRNLELSKTAKLLCELKKIDSELTEHVTARMWHSIIKNYLRRIDAPNPKYFERWVKIADQTSKQSVKKEVVSIIGKHVRRKGWKKPCKTIGLLTSDKEFIKAIHGFYYSAKVVEMETGHPSTSSPTTIFHASNDAEEAATWRNACRTHNARQSLVSSPAAVQAYEVELMHDCDSPDIKDYDPGNNVFNTRNETLSPDGSLHSWEYKCMVCHARDYLEAMEAVELEACGGEGEQGYSNKISPVSPHLLM